MDALDLRKGMRVAVTASLMTTTGKWVDEKAGTVIRVGTRWVTVRMDYNPTRTRLFEPSQLAEVVGPNPHGFRVV
jgi:hypothetical protein